MCRWCVRNSLIKISCCRNYSVKGGAYLCIEELLVRLELGREALRRVRQVLGLVAQPLLEGLVDVRLDVVRVELALALLVLAQTVPHLLVEPLLLLVQVALHAVVHPLPFIVLHLDLPELVPKCAQLLDLRRQFLLFVLDFHVDPCDQRIEVLQRLRLDIIELFLHLTDPHDLVLHL